MLIVFFKNVHRRCLTRFYMHLSKEYLGPYQISVMFLFFLGKSSYRCLASVTHELMLIYNNLWIRHHLRTEIKVIFHLIKNFLSYKDTHHQLLCQYVWYNFFAFYQIFIVKSNHWPCNKLQKRKNAFLLRSLVKPVLNKTRL